MIKPVSAATVQIILQCNRSVCLIVSLIKQKQLNEPPQNLFGEEPLKFLADPKLLFFLFNIVISTFLLIPQIIIQCVQFGADPIHKNPDLVDLNVAS